MLVCFSLSSGLLVVHRFVHHNPINGNYKFKYIFPWLMWALIFKSLPHSGLVIHLQSSSQPNYHETAIIISYSQDCRINTEISDKMLFFFYNRYEFAFQRILISNASFRKYQENIKGALQGNFFFLTFQVYKPKQINNL